ncbi:MAG: undecaprenyl/decaprenyl-phosphate alpha-N-acetylglucosaminyl 1-phosphate transferase [Elusimicrobiaceae bacterium]|nr:undecaprenyl/decaprenyl-phosphate alpha-N-acetylglucosaminyl 1-phosphate transferase [Elusimicrobiaceae bacterium]
MSNLFLYFFTFIFAFGVSYFSISPLKKLAQKYLVDKPTKLKNHKGNIPLCGGAIIATGFLGSLIILRLLTSFPSGTLHNLRGLFLGGIIIFILGLIDDFKKPKGLNPYIKLLFQTLAAYQLIHYDIKINFLNTPWDYIFTILWVVGLTNAFNLLDIMDGLAISQALIASLAFLLINLPFEYIYVNFAAVSLLGAGLAFWPQNHANKKIFLGDSGSMLLGFLLSALALGTRFSSLNQAGVFVPLLILALPIFDTIFVSIIRITKGINPLKGSADHFPLRLKKLGFKNKNIILFSISVSLILNILAYLITRTASVNMAICVYLVTLITFIGFGVFLKIKVKMP